MDKFEEKMRADGLNEAAIAAFRHNYEQLVAGVDGIVPEGSIEAIEVCAYLRRLIISLDIYTSSGATASTVGRRRNLR